MPAIDVSQLAGEAIRYNGDTWEFTGTITIKQNGSVLEAGARASDRVRGSRGTLQFRLTNPPASINPGNPGDFDVELTSEGGEPRLRLARAHTSDDYAIESLRYE